MKGLFLMKFFLSIVFFVTFLFAEVYDQRACVIGPQNCVHGGSIYVYDGSWARIGGSAKRVTFNYDGYMFVVNNQSQVYRRYGAGGWLGLGTVPGLVLDIDAHSDILGPVVSTSTGVYQRNGAGQWVIVASANNLYAISCRGYAVYGLRYDGNVVKYINGQIAGLYAKPVGAQGFCDISLSGTGDVYASYRVQPYESMEIIYKLDNFTSQWSTTVNTATFFDVSLYTGGNGYDQAILSNPYNGWVYWCDQLRGTNMYFAGCPVQNVLDVAVGDGSYDIMPAPKRIMNLDGLVVEKRDSVYAD